jgi:hypothetical protein
VAGSSLELMATIGDVSKIVSALPGVAEEERKDRPGHLAWSVAGKGFAWQRAYSKADLKRFGDQTPPQPPIVAVRTAGLHEKEALLAAGLPGIFTIPHFEGYAAVLVELGATRRSALREVLIEGWLAVAPTALAEEFLARRDHR